ncbi:hypothetical protein CHLNCDRAFT_137699 [Chlorella variabilis]|uniref:K Homology domain-containing protein n=1 Tax=Chlorella variabilis TaxID=554065 RepID=E1Z4A7_CHLVA|nr:hypothetical protein CHLNCDRAFT_137699 [Chlorella variabilis]EFN59020.1 hypothetical protein CHLNCDRAFT_137699 [Chlorella variabilis]|eukprot:XP_005851122.1 hypothetical protein CHLNCDRAFT_137699 [Chlorella variabilis]
MSSVTDALLQLRAKAQLSASNLRERKAQALAQLLAQQHAAEQNAGHTPSGPRRKSDGVEDEQQGIVSAEMSVGGGALLRVTLLAAGYVIGPAGASVRDVSRTTGADIRSWSESFQDASAGPAAASRRVRTIVIEGKRRCVVHALRIIAAAVDRYVDLTGGSYCGQAVDRAHVIDGCTFFYSPPPRAAVPFAAALRSHDSVASPAALKSPSFPGSPAAAADKENATGGGGSAGAPTHAALAPRVLLSPPFSPSRHQTHRVPPLSALPATPAAAGAATGAHTLQTALRTASGAAVGAMPSASEAMDVDHEEEQEQEEAPTPGYRTYSLFGGSGLGPGGSVLQREPFGGVSSLFASAFEASPTPSISAAGADSLFTSRGLPPLGAGAAGGDVGAIGAGAALPSTDPPAYSFLDAPSSAGPGAGSLLRTPSIGDDSLLAATGFPSYSSFANRASEFQSHVWDAPAPPPPSSALAAGPLAQLPLGAAVQGWCQQGSLFGPF